MGVRTASEVRWIETQFAHFAHGQQKFHGFNFANGSGLAKNAKINSLQKISNHMVGELVHCLVLKEAPRDQSDSSYFMF